MTIVPEKSTNRRVPAADRAQPVNWNPVWRQLYLAAKTPDRARQPVFTLASNPAYWEGQVWSWADWLDAVDAGYDVGLAPQLNDVVVLDCDVKYYRGELVVDPANPNLVTLAAGGVNGANGDGDGDGDGDGGEVVTRRGVDDLVRVTREAGRDPRELATYAVATPSGGVHLYYDVSAWGGCEAAGLRTQHHRDGWRVDVVATRNNWVAAPPTPGYRVTRDIPAAPLPSWLLEIIRGIGKMPPLGGRRRAERDDQTRRLRARVDKSTVADLDYHGVYETWLAAALKSVELANEYGGWNTTIFEVACDMCAVRLDRAEAERRIVAAARPWDERQLRAVRQTIASAWSYKERQLKIGRALR